MAQIDIDPGASPNDGTGTNWRDGWIAAQSNFDELYARWSESGELIIRTGTSPYITADGTSQAGFRWKNTGVDQWQMDNIVADDSLRIRSLGTVGDRVRILQNGNVGIGTTTPGSPLAVVGYPVYANNAAALIGGLSSGDHYKTAATGDAIVMVTNAT